MAQVLGFHGGDSDKGHMVIPSPSDPVAAIPTLEGSHHTVPLTPQLISYEIT